MKFIASNFPPAFFSHELNGKRRGEAIYASFSFFPNSATFCKTERAWQRRSKRHFWHWSFFLALLETFLAKYLLAGLGNGRGLTRKVFFFLFLFRVARILYSETKKAGWVGGNMGERVPAVGYGTEFRQIIFTKVL